MYGKIILHHSFVTGETKEFVLEFCIQKIRENKKYFYLFFFFVVKDIRLCVWKTRNLNIGGINLTKANYANLGDQVKFLNTIKFYIYYILNNLLKLFPKVKNKKT